MSNYGRSYLYCQKNVRGNFLDPSKYFFVFASSDEEADYIALKHGVYFNGKAKNMDCPCCGDRWETAYYSRVYGPSDIIGYICDSDITSYDISVYVSEKHLFGVYALRKVVSLASRALSELSSNDALFWVIKFAVQKKLPEHCLFLIAEFYYLAKITTKLLELQQVEEY
jgi:hypothetical protein